MLNSTTTPLAAQTECTVEQIGTADLLVGIPSFNDADTIGIRGALRFDINENWTITPQLVAQKMKAHGSTGVDPNVGNPDFGYDTSTADLAVKHFYPESSDDRWHQAALTVEGKIGNFDLTYVFSNMKRDVDSEADYADYGFWYDSLAGYGAYFYDNNGDLINPAQYIQATDGYKRTSHELRVSSPQENRLRMTAGLFWQKQTHDIFQRYKVDDLADDIEVNGISPTGYPMRMLKNSPAIGAGIRPNCEAYGYLLDTNGHCAYIDAYYREVALHPGAKKIEVWDKTCLCTHMRNFDCWTCGHYTYRLKDTTRKLEDGSYQLLGAEHIFRDYQYSKDGKVALPD